MPSWSSPALSPFMRQPKRRKAGVKVPAWDDEISAAMTAANPSLLKTGMGQALTGAPLGLAGNTAAVSTGPAWEQVSGMKSLPNIAAAYPNVPTERTRHLGQLSPAMQRVAMANPLMFGLEEIGGPQLDPLGTPYNVGMTAAQRPAWMEQSENQYDPLARQRSLLPDLSYPAAAQTQWQQTADQRAQTQAANETGASTMQEANAILQQQGLAPRFGHPLGTTPSFQERLAGGDFGGVSTPEFPGGVHPTYDPADAYMALAKASRDTAMAGDVEKTVATTPGPWDARPAAEQGKRARTSWKMLSDDERADISAREAERRGPSVPMDFRRDLITSRASGLPWEQVRAGRLGEDAPSWLVGAGYGKEAMAGTPESMQAMKDAAFLQALSRANPDAIPALIRGWQRTQQGGQLAPKTFMEKISGLPPDLQKKALDAWHRGDIDAASGILAMVGETVADQTPADQTPAGVSFPSPPESFSWSQLNPASWSPAQAAKIVGTGAAVGLAPRLLRGAGKGLGKWWNQGLPATAKAAEKAGAKIPELGRAATKLKMAQKELRAAQAASGVAKKAGQPTSKIVEKIKALEKRIRHFKQLTTPPKPKIKPSWLRRILPKLGRGGATLGSGVIAPWMLLESLLDVTYPEREYMEGDPDNPLLLRPKRFGPQQRGERRA